MTSKSALTIISSHILLIFLVLGIGKSYAQTRETSLEKVFLVLDRHHFLPAERLYYTAFVVNQKNEAQLGLYKLKVVLSNGNKQAIDSQFVHVNNGHVSGAFALPNKGGMYTITAFTSYQLNDLQKQFFTKEIYIQDFVERYFFIRNEFLDESYRPGQLIKSKTIVLSASGKPLMGLAVTIKMQINNEEKISKNLTTNHLGEIVTEFTLPENAITNAYLDIRTSFQGKVESLSSKIPIETREVLVEVFTENGCDELLAGVENTIVITAKDQNDRPKSLTGFLVDGKGERVSSFTTLHKGMASLRFTPKKGERYFLEYQPSANRAFVQIPVQEVGSNGSQLTFEYKDKSLIIKAYGNLEGKRVVIVGDGNVYANKQITGSNSFSHSMSITELPKGVLGVSVLGASDEVFAQRLFIHHKPSNGVQLVTNDSIYAPTTAIEAILKLPKEYKSAYYSMKVINNQYLNQIKDRSHSLVSWTALGAEFQTEIDEPQFYFNPKETTANQALQLWLVANRRSWRVNPTNGLIRAKPEQYYPRAVAKFEGRIATNYNYSNYQNGVKVRIKNTSLVTTTNESGYFVFNDIPSEIVLSNIQLTISKGFERMTYDVPQNIDFITSGFGESVGKTEYDRLGFIPSPLIKTRELQNQASFIQNKANFGKNSDGGLSFLGNRTDATSYSIDAMDVMPSMSFESRSLACVVLTVPSYLWYFGDDIGNWNYSIPQIYYETPFHVQVTSPTYYNHVQYGYPTHPNLNTLYWHPFEEFSNAKEHTLPFMGGSETGGYTIVCEGFMDNKEPFTASTTFLVQDAINAEIKTPGQVAIGDQLELKLNLENTTNVDKTVNLYYHFNTERTDIEVKVPAKSITSKTIKYTAPLLAQRVQFMINYTFDGQAKRIDRFFEVTPRGHERSEHISGTSSLSKRIELNTMLGGNYELEVRVVDNFVDLLTSTSKQMIRQPGGCFEQVSSSNYPNILALKVLESMGNTGEWATEIQRAKTALTSGYSKLTAYETTSKGFEWYGKNPPHESLTAYGLLQFHLMEEVGLTVDPEMVARNAKWLMSRSDGKGGFKFHPGKYGFSSATYEVNNAYISWVLSRLGGYDLSKQIDAIEKNYAANFDAYIGALLGNIYAELDQKDQAEVILKQLMNHYSDNDNGTIRASRSVMSSYGASLNQECYALTLLLVNQLSNELNEDASLLISKLLSGKSQYGFGNTQATALTLEALSNYLPLFNQPKKEIEYVVTINGKDFQNFTASDLRLGKTLIVPKSLFDLGTNTFGMRCSEDANPYEMNLKWLEDVNRDLHPELGFSMSYSKDTVAIGEASIMNFTLKNNTNEGKPQVVAVINLAGGFNYSLEELKYMRDEGVFDYYESVGNKLYLYFLEMGPNEEKNISLALSPQIEGNFFTAESFVYQYYTPEIRSAVSPSSVVIVEY
ncbi:MAG: hypothetical protein ACI9NN_001434 [Bacteroidia bacterium]|jgi:hypothetical protein